MGSAVMVMLVEVDVELISVWRRVGLNFPASLNKQGGRFCTFLVS